MKSKYIETIDFGRVPIRKTHTEGRWYDNIELSGVGEDGACFAEIRVDYRTNQPFAVLFDADWKAIYGG